MIPKHPEHAVKVIVLVLMGLFISISGYALHQEKEKLYVELKHILARQPGPEAAEQLQIYRHTLREKTKQLKVSGSFCTFLAEGWPHSGEHPWTRLPPWLEEPVSQRLQSIEISFFSTPVPGKPQRYPSAPRLIDPHKTGRRTSGETVRERMMAMEWKFGE